MQHSPKVHFDSKDEQVLLDAVEGMKSAMRDGKRLYFYGCGATGRLAKQVESSFWRPFWSRETPLLREELRKRMVDKCVGEMTGGDRALIRCGIKKSS